MAVKVAVFNGVIYMARVKFRVLNGVMTSGIVNTFAVNITPLQGAHVISKPLAHKQ